MISCPAMEKCGWEGAPRKRTQADSKARRVRGKQRSQARFPVAPPVSKAPEDYAAALQAIKRRVQRVRVRVASAANAELVLLYWDIGRMILERQKRAGWGAGVIDRLSADLRRAFPDQRGFSARNLKYMRAFCAAWPRRAIVQESLAQLPWYHQIALLEKLDRPAARLWYAQRAREHGWSHEVLLLKISGLAYARQGQAVSNFRATLSRAESQKAIQVFKDPYVFDFLGTAELRSEREIERGLVDHIQRFLLELGSGFAFVGRQVPLEVGDQDFHVDLLFYHLTLRCYVVIELKAVPFSPAFVGQLNLYLSAVDDLLRHPDDQPAIGLLLCRTKSALVVEYALRHLSRPIGVAAWETSMVKQLPKVMRGSLPSVEELEAELSARSPRKSQGGTRTS